MAKKCSRGAFLTYFNIPSMVELYFSGEKNVKNAIMYNFIPVLELLRVNNDFKNQKSRV